MKKGAGGDRGTTQTCIRRVEGNIFKLKEDLDAFLLQRSVLANTYLGQKSISIFIYELLPPPGWGREMEEFWGESMKTRGNADPAAKFSKKY
jgi:hypothetical protein